MMHCSNVKRVDIRIHSRDAHISSVSPSYDAIRGVLAFIFASLVVYPGPEMIDIYET